MELMYLIMQREVETEDRLSCSLWSRMCLIWILTVFSFFSLSVFIVFPLIFPLRSQTFLLGDDVNTLWSFQRRVLTRYQHPVVARKSNQFNVIYTVQHHGHIAVWLFILRTFNYWPQCWRTSCVHAKLETWRLDFPNVIALNGSNCES